MNLDLENVASSKDLEGSPPNSRIQGFSLALSVHRAVIMGPDGVPGSQGESTQLRPDPGGGLFKPPAQGVVKAMSISRHGNKGSGM